MQNHDKHLMPTVKHSERRMIISMSILLQEKGKSPNAQNNYSRFSKILATKYLTNSFMNCVSSYAVIKVNNVHSKYWFDLVSFTVCLKLIDNSLWHPHFTFSAYNTCTVYVTKKCGCWQRCFISHFQQIYFSVTPILTHCDSKENLNWFQLVRQ